MKEKKRNTKPSTLSKADDNNNNLSNKVCALYLIPNTDTLLPIVNNSIPSISQSYRATTESCHKTNLFDFENM